MIEFFDCFLVLICIPIGVPQVMEHADDVYEPAFVPRVVNGWPAKLGDVPYQIAFKGMNSRTFQTYATFCGGTLIGPSKLITAAHCFAARRRGTGKFKCVRSLGNGEGDTAILEGTYAVAGNLNNVARYGPDSMENGQWRELKTMHLPERYKFPDHDIAVGFTKEAFVYNKNVGSIDYATSYSDYKGSCLVSGFGRLSTYQSSERLMLANLEIVRARLCSHINRKKMDNFICTSDIIADVQKGDSGGPLVCKETSAKSDKGILVGVVCGNRRNIGSFFTRVSSYEEFIVSTGRTIGISGSGSSIAICMGVIIRMNIAILILFY